MPPAGAEHGATGMNLAGRLAYHVLTNQLGVTFLAETGFILQRDPDTVRAPDCSFIRKDQIPSEGLPKGYWPGAPTLAVEVTSPDDTGYEVEDKVQEWLDAGTERVWVVNPKRRTVTVHRSITDLTVLTENDTLDGETTVPGFRCRVGDIFS
jgi:Uma2 family endonuclease